jgi:hypothetical protein
LEKEAAARGSTSNFTRFGYGSAATAASGTKAS